MNLKAFIENSIRQTGEVERRKTVENGTKIRQDQKDMCEGTLIALESMESQTFPGSDDFDPLRILRIYQLFSS